MKNIYSKAIHDATMLMTMFAVFPTKEKSLGMVIFSVSMKSRLWKNSITRSRFWLSHSCIMAEKSPFADCWLRYFISTTPSLSNCSIMGGMMK